jgi:type I protein arginine methyltransferase
MYSLHFYGQMIADTARMGAYAAALRQVVNSDSVVMDLGSGPGVFALLACKLGARRVYAVEPGNVIGLAREAAAANGFADRIQFFESMSTEITLDERASIIVSDLRGVLPWFQQHIPSIIDARERHLARGGTLISHRDTVWAGVIEAAEHYEELIAPWEKNGFELDLSAGTRLITNNWRKTRIQPEQLLVDPVCWTTIDYHEVDSSDIQAEISWRAARTGTAHGVAVWFDSELVEGISFSNHPNSPEMIYGQGLFPFSQPVELMEGDRVKLRLAANLVGDDYVWRWDTDFFSGDDKARPEARPKVSYKQSTFFGVALSPALLQKARRA